MQVFRRNGIARFSGFGGGGEQNAYPFIFYETCRRTLRNTTYRSELIRTREPGAMAVSVFAKHFSEQLGAVRPCDFEGVALVGVGATKAMSGVRLQRVGKRGTVVAVDDVGLDLGCAVQPRGLDAVEAVHEVVHRRRRSAEHLHVRE